MNPKKLLKRLAQGPLRNVSFRDMVTLVEGFGFRLIRINGSHHIFSHPMVTELVNLQEVAGEPSRIKFANSCA